MSVEVRSPGTVVLPPSFSVDRLAGFEQEVLDHLDTGASQMTLDCSFITYPTSAHINAMWMALRICDSRQIPMHLAHPSAQLIRILRVLDLYELFAEMTGLVGAQETTLQMPTQPPDHHFSVALRANMDRLRPVVTEFVNYLHSLGLGDADATELQTVFYEIAANIIEHAGLTADDHISVSAESEDDGIRLTFVDSGVAFDPRERIERTKVRQAPPKTGVRGYGLVMINRLIDELEYRRLPQEQNELIVKRKWRRQA